MKSSIFDNFIIYRKDWNTIGNKEAVRLKICGSIAGNPGLCSSSYSCSPPSAYTQYSPPFSSGGDFDLPDTPKTNKSKFRPKFLARDSLRMLSSENKGAGGCSRRCGRLITYHIYIYISPSPYSIQLYSIWSRSKLYVIYIFLEKVLFGLESAILVHVDSGTRNYAIQVGHR